MKLELKYVATGVLIGCIGLTTVFASSKIKNVVESNFGLVFEGKKQEQLYKMIGVQFEGQSSVTSYMNMHAFLNALSLEGEYDKNRNAFVIVNNGWSTKTPVKPANAAPAPSPTPSPQPSVVPFPEMHPVATPTPAPTTSSAQKIMKIPPIDENGYYDFSYDANNIYKDFFYNYLKNASFELNGLSGSYSAYQFSFYDGNIVKLYKEDFSGAKSVLTGKYETIFDRVNITWDKIYYLDANNVVQSMGAKSSSTQLDLKIKANSPEVIFTFVDKDGTQLSELPYKKTDLKEYYKNK